MVDCSIQIFLISGVQLRRPGLPKSLQVSVKRRTLLIDFTPPGDSDQVTNIVEDSGKELGIKVWGKGTNVCCASTVSLVLC